MTSSRRLAYFEGVSPSTVSAKTYPTKSSNSHQLMRFPEPRPCLFGVRGKYLCYVARVAESPISIPASTSRAAYNGSPSIAAKAFLTLLLNYLLAARRYAESLPVLPCCEKEKVVYRWDTRRKARLGSCVMGSRDARTSELHGHDGLVKS